MKTYIKFLTERPLRAHVVNGKWLYDKSLYVGMDLVDMKSRQIYNPVFSWTNHNIKNDVEVAHVFALMDKQKIRIVYTGKFKHLGSKTIKMDWNEVLPTVHKDTKI